MNKKLLYCLLVVVVSILTNLLTARVLADTNLEGMEGHLNTPSAQIQNDEIVNFGWAQTIDKQIYLNKTKYNYYLSLSLFPKVDFGGRYSQYLDVPSRLGPSFGDYKDRSTYVKFQLVQQNASWPDITVGAIDLFGQSRLNETYFGVIGKDFDLAGKNLRLDLGWGENRYQGIFAGATYQLAQSLGLKLEYDTKTINCGLYFKPSSRFGIQAGVVNNGDLALAANFSLPLYSGVREEPLNSKILRNPVQPSQEGCSQIASALVKQGFEDVKVAYEQDTNKLNIVLSQRRFRNHFAGLGLAVSIASALAPENTNEVTVNYLLEGNPAVCYAVTPDEHLQFINNEITTKEYVKSLKIRRGNVDANYPQPELNDSQFTADFGVAPSIDYILGLIEAPTRTRISVMPQARGRLWDRIAFEASAKLPIQNDMPWPYDKTEPYIETALGRLNLAFNNGVWFRASAGQYEQDVKGWGAEIQIPLNDNVNTNSHPIYLGANYRRYESSIQLPEQEFFMGRITQSIPELNLLATLWAGQFLNKDSGYVFDIRRTYGNTIVNCYISRPQNYDNYEGGFRFTFPLSAGSNRVPTNIHFHDDYFFNFSYRSNTNAWQQITRPAGDILDYTYTLQPEYIYHNLRELKRISGYIPGSF